MAQQFKSELKTIFRHSSLFSLFNVMGQMVSIFLLPLYTRYLTPKDYGVLEILYFIQTIIGILINFGVTEALSRFYFDSEDPKHRNTVVSTTIFGLGSVYIGMCLLLMLASPLCAQTFLDSRDYTLHFQILFLTLGINFGFGVVTTYFRVQQKYFSLLMYSLASMILTVAMNILFVVFLRWGSLGMLSATLVTQTVLSIVTLAYILRRTGVHFSWPVYKDMIKFGLPLIPSALGSYVVIASDRYFVKVYDGLADAGLYSLGYKMGILTHSLLTVPFLQVWLPRRYEYYDKDNSEQVFARIFTYFTALLIFGALALSLFAKDVLRILTTEKFWSAWGVAPIVALACVFHGLYYHFNISVTYTKQTKYYAYTNIIAGVLNLALNFALIWKWGMYGAAWATMITYAARSALIYYYGNKLAPIIWEGRRFVAMLASAGVLYAAGRFLSSDALLPDIAIQGGLLCLFPVALFVTGTFSPSEFAAFKDFVFMRGQRLLQGLTRRSPKPAVEPEETPSEQI